MMKKIAVAFLAAASILTVTACNTVRGMGQDIEKGGEAIQRATK